MRGWWTSFKRWRDVDPDTLVSRPLPSPPPVREVELIPQACTCPPGLSTENCQCEVSGSLRIEMTDGALTRSRWEL